MSYTTTQLADEVLRSLGVVDAADTPDAVDRTYVTNRYTALWEELASHGNELVYWSQSSIPNAVFNILVDMLVLECAAAFGKPMAPAEKSAQRQLVEKRLRRHTSVQSSGLPVRAVYY